MQILLINSKDTHYIRRSVLKGIAPSDKNIFPLDEEELSFHLGGFVEKKLVSIASFYFNKHPLIDAHHQYQIHGMATLHRFRHKGLSSALLKTAFPIIKQNLCKVIWCYTYSDAVGFYKKVGFEDHGTEVEIEGKKAYLMINEIQ